MKRHKTVETLLAAAERERRCAYGTAKSVCSALGRRAKIGELQRVSANAYVKPDYWAALNPPERSLHIARTLGARHPDWVFAGIVAAAAHGFEHQWLLHGGPIDIVSSNKGDPPSRNAGSAAGMDAASGMNAGAGMNADTDADARHGTRIRRIYAPRCALESAAGITVTGKARTVVDCCMMLEFRYALPIVDSALAQGVPRRDILAVCGSLRRNCLPVFRALHYADPRSENGGESLMRGTIVDSGLMVPEIQVPFVDPQTGRSYRVDFAWRLADGRIVVAEFDGTDKYVDPAMTGRRSIQGIVLAEREREAALRRADVTDIVRCSFDDVVRAAPMIDELCRVGIPRSR
ncbi:hypothetical protein KIH79_10345 [Bifidobacterium sp. 82T10]|uniref:CTP synthase n=1 Tax=Bifidobacterium miconis TaxID=2834435 RepID=A0ABS6WHT1_9BIFI|nr:hypothetical protein [Bifidobacterium miconis]MBW3093310.1 hypothetical protein [Bifidobacterium miconis]